MTSKTAATRDVVLRMNWACAILPITAFVIVLFKICEELFPNLLIM